MKSYTDLEQSKKLAEILPVESADFHFSANQSPQGYLGKPIWGNSEYADYSAFPCWSLAALLSVIPDYTLQTNRDGTVCVICESENPMISNAYDNPVDACCEIITELHEQKIL